MRTEQEIKAVLDIVDTNTMPLEIASQVIDPYVVPFVTGFACALDWVTEYSTSTEDIIPLAEEKMKELITLCKRARGEDV